MNKEAKVLTLVSLIAVAALSRLIPHPPNFAPITAIALFSGTYFLNRWLGYFVAIAAMLLSDAIIGFHSLQFVVYLSFFVSGELARHFLKHPTVLKIVGVTLTSSVLFFLTTNLAVWLSSGMYPLTGEGLVACFVAAIPFFENSVLGDFVYVAFLYGGYALVRQVVFKEGFGLPLLSRELARE